MNATLMILLLLRLLLGTPGINPKAEKFERGEGWKSFTERRIVHSERPAVS